MQAASPPVAEPHPTHVVVAVLECSVLHDSEVWLYGMQATGRGAEVSHMCVAQIDAVQVDTVFEGLEGGPGSLIKYNPLSNVSSPEVWNFLRAIVGSGALPGLTDTVHRMQTACAAYCP